MTQSTGTGVPITRRSWIVLAVSALTGCGGGGTNVAGLPGTGGTGISALGSIQGFGSVIINGIKFDDTQAAVQIDGQAATSADLRLGMVAVVRGERGSDPALGTASSIECWSVAQGVVSQVTSGQFTVAGMTIQTNSATVLQGISSAALISAGMRVTVWGLQAGSNGNIWTATRIAIASTTTVVTTGLVSLAGSSVYLNGLLLTGVAMAGLPVGEPVRVQGVLSVAGDSLQVASVKALYGDSFLASQGEAEIEGLVTAILSPARFLLGSVTVDVSALTVSGSTALIAVGARCEVEGVWNAGVLQATNLEFSDEQTLLVVEIDAPIEQFTSLANFVVRGQRCDASGVSQIGNGTAGDLRVGVRVHVKGSKAGDVLMVTELEIDR